MNMAAIKVPITSTNIDQAALVTLLNNMATAINALITDHNTLRTKLNADAGVTDTNYAASTASTISLVS
jgi:hypothetical protein